MSRTREKLRTKRNVATDASPKYSVKNNVRLTSGFRSGLSMRSMQNPQQSIRKPPDQVILTDEERKEEFSRDLKVEDPQAPQSLVRLKFSQNQYEEVGVRDPMIINYEQVGRIALINKLKIEQETEMNEEEDSGDSKQDTKVLRNQFNYTERATQNKTAAYMDQATITEAPTPKNCTGVTNARVIGDAYAKDKHISLAPKPHSALFVTRIMERVVNQNLDPNVVLDFRHFDDARDTITKDKGYTLPLWEFSYDSLNGFSTTSIEWNPSIPDLFGCTYSSTSNQQKGYLCTWTLKNQSNPRDIIELNSPAVSMNWNPYEPSLVAVGTFDGNVHIFDARLRNSTPVYSTSKSAKRHTSSVTVVRWQMPDTSNNNTLLSASLDGRIILWTLMQNEMKPTEIATLPAGVVSLDYYNDKTTHFTVACDDGRIYRVLKTRTTKDPTSFEAHSPPCFSIHHNKFHPNVYATSGTDWSVKLWREGEDTPLQVYDYAPNYVNDVKFAPHSSTIFASITSDGELFIYDVAVDRYNEICKTDIIEANDGALTTMCFHPKLPVILIGDDKGRIHSLKMSPNLRRNTRTEKEEEEKMKIVKTESSKNARGLLPNLAVPIEEDDDNGNTALEEEARKDALIRDETAKFEKSMGVSWVK
ncbi:dynein intermediate chain 1, axonemal [Histomonas meleagridis]|uniref:dynein intermediate chain 1, axonemal n=1 Tax=Histomonas meleagridis TaxID=135588 RepID=UPI0035593959|nr:dynein intermediate chain 1, axonemal [Histomonas meleagridis]KAH0797680.1 dynein intermediate chain 1, axonemal [Histomonas meleagridis]